MLSTVVIGLNRCAKNKIKTISFIRKQFLQRFFFIFSDDCTTQIMYDMKVYELYCNNNFNVSLLQNYIIAFNHDMNIKWIIFLSI